MKAEARKELAMFLKEDIGKKDVTSELLPKKRIKANIIARERATIAGVTFAREIFALKGVKSKVIKKDGSQVKKNQNVMTVSGLARDILSCERTALNLLSRMSGIATHTNTLTKKITKYNTLVYATRKTAPGLRFFDKEAVRIGGGQKHRMKLDESIMIKDNHIAVTGSMTELIRSAKKNYRKIEVEVENVEDALIAAREGASIIMLDNFSPKKVHKTIIELKKTGLKNRVKIEASGGISERNIVSYAKAGVDFISSGKITNAAKGIDLSLEVIK